MADEQHWRVPDRIRCASTFRRNSDQNRDNMSRNARQKSAVNRPKTPVENGCKTHKSVGLTSLARTPGVRLIMFSHHYSLEFSVEIARKTGEFYMIFSCEKAQKILPKWSIDEKITRESREITRKSRENYEQMQHRGRFLSSTPPPPLQSVPGSAIDPDGEHGARELSETDRNLGRPL